MFTQSAQHKNARTAAFCSVLEWHQDNCLREE